MVALPPRVSVWSYFSVRFLTSVKFISETSSIFQNLIELGQYGSNFMICV